MEKYALSKQGAIDFIKACVACVLVDLSLMMPVRFNILFSPRFSK